MIEEWKAGQSIRKGVQVTFLGVVLSACANHTDGRKLSAPEYIVFTELRPDSQLVLRDEARKTCPRGFKIISKAQGRNAEDAPKGPGLVTWDITCTAEILN